MKARMRNPGGSFDVQEMQTPDFAVRVRPLGLEGFTLGSKADSGRAEQRKR